MGLVNHALLSHHSPISHRVSVCVCVCGAGGGVLFLRTQPWKVACIHNLISLSFYLCTWHISMSTKLILRCFPQKRSYPQNAYPFMFPPPHTPSCSYPHILTPPPLPFMFLPHRGGHHLVHSVPVPLCDLPPSSQETCWDHVRLGAVSWTQCFYSVHNMWHLLDAARKMLYLIQ